MIERKEKIFGTLFKKDNIIFYLKNNKQEEAFTLYSDSANSKIVTKYYTQLSNFQNRFFDMCINDCFAVRLAKLLISIIQNNEFSLCDNRFSNDFYNLCLKNISYTDMSKEINDDELLLIYIKQCINILKVTNIFSCSKNRVEVIDKNFSNELLFVKLFNAFWNEIEWEEIFPSDPNAAKELKINRNIIKDLILKNYNKFELEKVANEFFELTGYGKKNDLMMISFLDFYFFTWLRHFGIIKYINNSMNELVYIQVTNKGRQFFNSVF